MALGLNPSNPGLAGGGARALAADYDLFLKVFSGEILTAFNETNVAKDLIMTRTISSGKSAQFPVTGKATAKYHTPGDDLLAAPSDSGSATGYLSQIEHQEKVITIDDMLVASTLIPRIDELKNHYDLRSIYSAELGKALAKRLDIQILKTLFAAGLTTTENVTGSGTGTIVTANTGDVGGIIGALYDVAAALDDKEVPDDGRFAILTPAQYYKLFASDNVAINKDFSNGGNADAAKGRILEVAGIKLYKSPHLEGVQTTAAQQDEDDAFTLNEPFANTGVNTDDAGYNGNLAGVNGGSAGTFGFVAGHSSAVGCVKLLDLATESEYLIERQSTLFVAKYAMGLGVLRPESAVVVDASS
jgi:hypothetical protein